MQIQSTLSQIGRQSSSSFPDSLPLPVIVAFEIENLVAFALPPASDALLPPPSFAVPKVVVAVAEGTPAAAAVAGASADASDASDGDETGPEFDRDPAVPVPSCTVDCTEKCYISNASLT